MYMKTHLYTQSPIFRIFFFVAATSLFSSCYSVRISNKQGTGEPDPINMSAGYYRGLKVNVIDTTINLKLLANEVMVLESCPEGCFHTLEYRVTLGDVLLSGITLGKKRRIHVKYVCLKESF
jgi:hypothetical protein